MQIPTIIEQLSAENDNAKLPVEALQAAKNNWLAIYPFVDQLIDKFIEHPNSLTRQESNLLYFGILLMAEMQQQGGLEKLLCMCAREDDWHSDLGILLGDTITELMPTLFYLLADNDSKALHNYILDTHPSEYCRAAAIEAMFQQYIEKTLESDEFESMFEEWMQRFQTEQNPALSAFILSTLCNFSIDANLKQYQEKFLELDSHKKLDPEYLSRKDIETWDSDCSYVKETPFNINKNFNVIEELSRWHGFSDKSDKDENDIEPDEDELEALHELLELTYSNEADILEPYIAPAKIGRNAPCPCGSGKKYKKCCLH